MLLDVTVDKEAVRPESLCSGRNSEEDRTGRLGGHLNGGATSTVVTGGGHDLAFTVTITVPLNHT